MQASDKFDRLRGQFNSAQDKQAGFQERCVRAILKAAGASLPKASVWRAQIRREDGIEGVGLSWFMSQYPYFPAILFSSKLNYTRDIPLSSVMGTNFAKLPWVKQYRERAQEYGYDLTKQAVALCWNWPAADGASLMVVHNYAVSTVTDVLGADEKTYTRIIRTYGTPPVTYVMEPLAGFISAIGNDWLQEG